MHRYTLMSFSIVCVFAANVNTGIHSPLTSKQFFSGTIAKRSSYQSIDQQIEIPTLEFVGKSSFAPEPLGNATLMSFSNGIEFDTRTLGKSGEPDLPQELTTSYRSDEYGYYIVQVKGPIYEYHKTQLESYGAKIFFYMKNYGFVCGIQNQAVLDHVRSMGNVTWAGIYQPAYKICSRIEREPDEFTATILLFENADLQELTNTINAMTGVQNKIITSEFHGEGYTNKKIRIKIKKSDVATIAKLKEVYWIEPWHKMIPFNDRAQWCVQQGNSATNRTIWAKDICGRDQYACILDTGLRPSQYFLDWPGYDPGTWYYDNTNPKVVAQQPSGRETAEALGWPLDWVSRWGDESVNSYHGTHTSGSTCGWDSARGGSYAEDGMAYQARLFFLDGGGDSGAVYMPSDLNILYAWPYDSTLAHDIPRILTMSNSWGDSTANGDYTANCMENDQFCWTHKDFLVLYSNGNDGTYGGSGVGHRAGAPATAKNCLAVGALQTSTTNTSYANARSSYSSFGLTTDRRYKPDIAAPGGTGTTGSDDIWSANGSTDNGVLEMQGTSMACPIAAGASLLARQYLEEGWYPTGTKVSSDAFDYILSDLIKVILMQGDSVSSATGYKAMCADSMVGWGRVCLDTALYFSGNYQRLALVQNLTGLVTGEEAIYKINLPSGATNIRISLSWTDYPSTPASYGLINDLDLVLIRPGTPPTQYKGNMWSSANESASNPSARDSLNVREAIRLRTLPAAGIWTIKVIGTSIPYGPVPFAMAVTYRHTTTQVAGRVLLDKPVYRANDFFVDTVLIRVEDENLGSAGVVDNATVRLFGKRTETQPETLLIPELAANAYVFERKIPLLFHKAVHNDGKLSVAQNDTITAIYVDASPAFTDTMLALVDAYYFMITDVLAELSTSGVDVAIKWNTNENSGQKINYGLNPANLNLVAQADTPLVLDHVVNISSLTQDTVYYFDVESKDYRGNVVKDNNGGRHYSFSTVKPKGVDILVALMDGIDKTTPTGSALPDLRWRFEKAIKAGGWTYDWWETSDHGGNLPPRSILKNYKAIFAPSEDEYPPYTRAQQDTITQYEQNGGRIAFSGHDFLWHAWDNSSTPGFDTIWCKNYLQARYKYDGTAGTGPIYGVSGDPITNDYYGTPVSYTLHRSGAAYDSFECLNRPPNGWDGLAGGTASPIWRWAGQTAGRIGSRWESGTNHGSLGDGVWGGYKTRTIMNAFSVTQMDTTKLPDILNKEFIWLIGHDHPDVTISSPSTGSTYNASPVSIAWTPTTYGGSAVDTTWLEYSSDAGGTWKLITKATGMSSPYSWNVSSLQNHYKYRVKVTVNDKDVYPSMKGFASTGNFVIKRSTGDTIGPTVSPQSIIVEKNPKIVTTTDTLLNFTAVLNDSETGLSNIGGARWYVGGIGEFQMFPDDGTWSDDIKEKVLGAMKFNYTPGTTKICTLQVRGMDNAAKANNWGPYYTRTFTLVDGGIGGIGMLEHGASEPLTYSLSAPLPNPFRGRVKIQFALPEAKKVNLRIYNCLGQVVRTLIDADRKPGVYTVIWNGRDNIGRDLAAGIYFYKFETDEFQSTKKAVLLR